MNLFKTIKQNVKKMYYSIKLFKCIGVVKKTRNIMKDNREMKTKLDEFPPLNLQLTKIIFTLNLKQLMLSMISLQIFV